MPSTAKDSLSEPTTTAGPAKNEVQKSQPGNAAGTEIPVTVHASRYSAASKGSAKLPPVHEETRTVIVLPQGAVVRLSATVAVGELVVLTNKRTGADVICRVTNIKAQPGKLQCRLWRSNRLPHPCRGSPRWRTYLPGIPRTL